VLADEGGLVSGVPLQPRRDVVPGLREGFVAAVGADVVAHPVVVAVLSGEDLGSGGAAQGVVADEPGELHAAGGEQSRGLGHPPEVGPAHVVGGDQDDVRPRRDGGRDGLGAGAALLEARLVPCAVLRASRNGEF
jgi:hypothetical protein